MSDPSGVDPIATASAIAMVKDALVAICTLVATCVGVWGLSTWRRQLVGQAEYALARQLLLCVLNIREALYLARDPVMKYAAEPSLQPEKLEARSAKERNWHSLVQAYERRWMPVSDALTKFEASLIEAEVLWGAEPLATHAKALRAQVHQLHAALSEHIDRIRPESDYPTQTGEERESRRALLWGSGNPATDSYASRLAVAVANFETFLRPRLGHKVHS